LAVRADRIAGAGYLEGPEPGSLADDIRDQYIDARLGIEGMIQSRRRRALQNHRGAHGVGAARPPIEQRRHLTIDVDLVPERGELLQLNAERVIRSHRLRFPAAGIESASV